MFETIKIIFNRNAIIRIVSYDRGIVEQEFKKKEKNYFALRSSKLNRSPSRKRVSNFFNGKFRLCLEDFPSPSYSGSVQWKSLKPIFGWNSYFFLKTRNNFFSKNFPSSISMNLSLYRIQKRNTLRFTINFIFTSRCQHGSDDDSWFD